MPTSVAVLAPAVCVSVSQDTLVDVIVHESLESLSSSEVVMLYEYAASSLAAVTAVLEIAGASLVLATVMVNESVAAAPATSLAVMTTLCEPTLASAGVPLSAPAVQVSHDGTVVQARVTTSPESTSLAVVVYEYAASSVAEVTAVLVIVGASLVLATTMVNESVAVAPATSLAVMTTLCEPTSSLVGVPLSAPAVQVSQDGTVVQARVTTSPESTSLAVVVYEYAASSVAEVTAVLEIVGASLVLATTMVKVSVSLAPAASATVTVTLCEPTSPLAGVPARVAVLAPAV